MIFWRRINQFKHSIEDPEDQDRPGTPITITKPLLHHRTSRPNNNSLTMIPIFLYINFKHKHRYPMAPPKESFKIIFIFENSWATNPLNILETSWPQAIKSSWVSVEESSKIVVHRGQFEPKCMVTVKFKIDSPPSDLLRG